MLRISFLSVAVNGWKLASHAFAGHPRGYLLKQQLKSFLSALFDPRFAAKWFEILKSDDFITITEYRKRLYFKPFRVYMSTQWTKEQKVKVIRDTYRFIQSNNEVFTQLVTHVDGIEIARFKLNDTLEGTLKLWYDDTYRKEGELVISFECPELGGMIASTAFAFEEIKSGQWICRIACVQGHKKLAQNSSKITQKMLHGLRPKSLVVFATQELSRQFGFTAIYGVGDGIQVYHRKHLIYLPRKHSIGFDYDAIWNESGGQPISDGWFEIPLTPVRKDYQEIKSHKRALYQRRYSLLDELSLKIANTVKKLTYSHSPKIVDTVLNEVL